MAPLLMMSLTFASLGAATVWLSGFGLVGTVLAYILCGQMGLGLGAFVLMAPLNQGSGAARSQPAPL